jgi:Flp pilus assembly pilin Flp
MLTGVALRLFLAIQCIGVRADDESGQTLAEYGLIISIMVVAILVIAVTVFRDVLPAAFNSALPCLTGSC